MINQSGWQSRETQPSQGVVEYLRNSKARLLGYTAALALMVAPTAVADTASVSKNKNSIEVPTYDGGHRRIPRHKSFLNAVEARNNILERYAYDQYSLPQAPPMGDYDRGLHKMCVYGKLRYVASYDNGAIDTGRVDEDTVGIDMFGMDDCSRYRESNVVVGLETRKSSKEEFVTANIAPGVIKWFASSPEYGTEYFGAFNMAEYSCKENPDLQVRFTVENITRSNWLPVAIRVRPEKPLEIIDCE